MKKFSIQEIEQIILRSVEDDQTRSRIMSQVAEVANRQNTEEDDTIPREECSSVTVLIGPQEVLDLVDTDQLYAYTVSCPIARDHNGLVTHLINKAFEYNSKKKRKNSKLAKLAEIFSKLKPNSDLDQYPKRIYTKEASIIVKTVNLNIPQNDPIG